MAGLVFPHPTISKNQLIKHLVKLVNLNFSLTNFNHESSDTVKGLCKRKDNKKCHKHMTNAPKGIGLA